jgi:hypothetical protein
MWTQVGRPDPERIAGDGRRAPGDGRRERSRSRHQAYSVPVTDLPLALREGLDERLARILDVEGKIPRVLEALGPVGGRDVLLVGRADGLRARQLAGLGARLVVAPESPGARDLRGTDGSVDVVVGLWSSFRGVSPAEIAEAERVTRPGGRLLVVHDYGRDDVSRLRGDLPEYGSWSHRSGPFLTNGFRLRVVHCFWTFDSTDDAREFLGAAFGDAGVAMAASMTRPRLSYNVAVYHRTLGTSAAGARA